MNRIRALCVFVLLAIGLGNTAMVAAHAEYESSLPEAGATVVAAPTQIKIVFSEELKAEGNTISVKDASGGVADKGDTTLDRSDADRKTLLVSLKSGLANGTYTVSWKNSSADGHNEEGDFTFVIGTASASTPSTLPKTGGEANLPATVLLVALSLLGGAWMLRRMA